LRRVRCLAVGQHRNRTGLTEKSKLRACVRRIRGQIETLERGLESERCADVLMLIASVRGTVNGLMAELMEDHIRRHIVDPTSEPDHARAQ